MNTLREDGRVCGVPPEQAQLGAMVLNTALVLVQQGQERPSEQLQFPELSYGLRGQHGQGPHPSGSVTTGPGLQCHFVEGEPVELMSL